MVYLIVLFTFASLFLNLNTGVDKSEQYSGIKDFAYILTSFRMTIGDMETDTFGSDDPTKPNNAKSYLTWGIWLIGAFLTNIVFLNFIIAVISDSYAKVM